MARNKDTHCNSTHRLPDGKLLRCSRGGGHKGEHWKGKVTWPSIEHSEPATPCDSHFMPPDARGTVSCSEPMGHKGDHFADQGRYNWKTEQQWVERKPQVQCDVSYMHSGHKCVKPMSHDGPHTLYNGFDWVNGSTQSAPEAGKTKKPIVYEHMTKSIYDLDSEPGSSYNHREERYKSLDAAMNKLSTEGWNVCASMGPVVIFRRRVRG